MPWVRIADDFPDHPKVVRAGHAAAWLYVCGLAYANRYLTDGFIPGAQVRRLADLEDVDGLAARLIEVGLWEQGEGGYRIHDYLEYQPSAETVRRERTMRETRKELYADPFITEAVKKRDRDRCRYCGCLVRWRDRRGPAGGTLDHVIPDGGNSVENIVVACRACNARKGRRTPEQAGMPLLPAGSPPPGTGTELDQEPEISIHPARTRTRPVKSATQIDPPLASQGPPRGNGATAPAKAKVASETSGKSRATPPPDILEPTETEYRLGEAVGLSRGQVDLAVSAMLDHWRSKGEQRADWHASLRTWLRNAPKYDQQRALPHRNGTPSSTTDDALAARMEARAQMTPEDRLAAARHAKGLT